MNIRKAIIKAQAKQKGITREKWMPGPEMTILATNTSACCLIIPYEWNGDIGKRWEPSLDDLIATDWIAI